MTERALASRDDEAGVLGSVLLSDRALSTLVVDVGLRPEHFHGELHRVVFGAMLALHDRGEPVDVATVTAETERRGAPIERGVIDELTASVPMAANAPAYGRRIVELAMYRAKRAAAYGILEAVNAEDRDALADAEGELQALAPERRRSRWEPDALGAEVLDWLDGDGGDRFALPWARLTKGLAGGLRRGTVTLVGGHSSHGKSAASDQILDTIVQRHGVDAAVYINEMTRHERALRYVARETGIALERLLQPDRANLTDVESAGVLKAVQSFPWTVVEAEGWSADEIARDIRAHRPDVALVDIFQLIATRDGKTAEWDAASRVLNAAAKQAGSVLIVTTHLNEARSETVRPRPVLGDIRNTGQLKNDADNVLFVWREQERDGDGGAELLDSGVIYIAKARMGTPGADQYVEFDGKRMRFLSTDPSARRESDDDRREEPF